MRHGLAPFVLSGVFVACGCGANPNAPSPTVPATLSIQAGQTSVAGALSVKFIGVTNDSRCPIDALCITSGDANLQFELRVGSQSAALELQVASPTRRRSTYRGYAIEVRELRPYPSAGTRIDPADYRVTLEIMQLP